MLMRFIDEIKSRAKNNKTLLANFSYITVLQVFVLLTPLITYPYLTRVLGTELYGLVITAQILSGYATIIVKFGFDSVSARHVSIWRGDASKLSEIVSSILYLRLILWIASFIIYIIIVIAVPIYRQHFLLFLFSSFTFVFSVLSKYNVYIIYISYLTGISSFFRQQPIYISFSNLN